MARRLAGSPMRVDCSAAPGEGPRARLVIDLPPLALNPILTNQTNRVNVNVYAAKTNLSRLLDRAERGEEVVIMRNGRPVAKLVPVTTSTKPRKLGTLKGRVRVSRDFDAPLPDETIDAFEGKPRDRRAPALPSVDQVDRARS